MTQTKIPLTNNVLVPLDLSISAVQGGLFSVSFVPDPKEGVKGNPETLTFLDFEGMSLFVRTSCILM